MGIVLSGGKVNEKSLGIVKSIGALSATRDLLLGPMFFGLAELEPPFG